MIPLFFGDADKPLFGIHHQPSSSSQLQDASIVLCNPIGFEYGRAHSIMRHLAKKLSENGYHVLRFDYYATGDSSGLSDAICVKQCLKDIVLSCDEIKTVSATRKVIVVGYRYGAMLAAFASESYKFSRLVMWDPVVNGDVYLNDLQVLHNQMLVDADRFDLRFLSNTDSSTELVGHDFPDAFRAEIKSLKFENLEKIKTRKIDVFSSNEGYKIKSLINENSFLAKAENHDFDGKSEWKNVEKIEAKVLPDSSIKNILDVIG